MSKVPLPTWLVWGDITNVEDNGGRCITKNIARILLDRGLAVIHAGRGERQGRLCIKRDELVDICCGQFEQEPEVGCDGHRYLRMGEAGLDREILVSYFKFAHSVEPQHAIWQGGAREHVLTFKALVGDLRGRAGAGAGPGGPCGGHGPAPADGGCGGLSRCDEGSCVHAVIHAGSNDFILSIQDLTLMRSRARV